MKARHSWLNIGLLIAGLALPVAAIGCGDDDDDGSSSGSGGSGGGGGKAGASGGGAGKSGSSGGNAGGASGSASPSAAMCKTTTKAILTGGALLPECGDCLCDENLKTINACNAKAQDCWGLIGCVSEKCPDVSEQTACLSPGGACASFGAGIATATPVGPIIRGACAESCLADEATNDAGTDDGGTP